MKVWEHFFGPHLVFPYAKPFLRFFLFRLVYFFMFKLVFGLCFRFWRFILFSDVDLL